MLAKIFPKEIKHIYKIAGTFREGLQVLTSLPDTTNQFQQLLHFLSLNERQPTYKFLPEEEIQKVIFDHDYLKYMKKKDKQALESPSKEKSRLKFV